MGIVRLDARREGHDVRDQVAEIGGHGESIGLIHRHSKVNIYRNFPHTKDNGGMDTWTHRSHFKKLASDYRKAKGINLDQLAIELGLERSTLDGYLYGKKGKPSIEVLQLAATLFECSILEFVDDPGDDLGGIAPGQLSEAKRLVGRLIFKDIASADVTDEDALAYLKAFQALKDSGK